MPRFEVEVRYTKVEIYHVEAKDEEEAKEIYSDDDFSHHIIGDKEVWKVTKEEED